MTYTITLAKSQRQFTVESNEIILQAAQKQNIALPYGCRNGTCGACKALVVSGKINQHSHSASALSNDEKEKGYALLCSAQACSNITLNVHEIANLAGQTVRKMLSKIKHFEKLSDDVMIVDLQLQAGQTLDFIAGQYIELLLPNHIRRAYSIASSVSQNNQLQLHIRHMPGGAFTDRLFNTMKIGDIVRFEGPLGSFFLREDSLKPIIFLASGTGFAPIKAMLETIFEKGIKRPIYFYWGGRSTKDLYQINVAQNWAMQYPFFKFIPVLSELLSHDTWSGRRGFVHRTVIEDFPDLSDFEVYACGAPVMVEAALRDFTKNHALPLEAFFADAFTSQADLANPID